MRNVVSHQRVESLRRFDQARRSAIIKTIAAKLTGQETHLLPFADVRRNLRQQNPLYRGASEVALDAIVGSVGRYKEFTRQYLPLNDGLRERWIAVDDLATSMTGWPPIDLYQVGNIYFVKDGNHRVSVARQLKHLTIEAHIWEFPDDLQISPDDNLDTIFIQLGERNFLAKTNLDELIPDHGIRFTTPGRFNELLAQIENLRATLALIDGYEMGHDEAVVAWYEMVYLPAIQIIEESTLLDDFSGRTEADLFVWMSLHREQIEDCYGECTSLAELAELLAAAYKEGSIERLTRNVRRLLGSQDLPPLQSPDGSGVAVEES